MRACVFGALTLTVDDRRGRPAACPARRTTDAAAAHRRVPFRPVGMPRLPGQGSLGSLVRQTSACLHTKEHVHTVRQLSSRTDKRASSASENCVYSLDAVIRTPN